MDKTIQSLDGFLSNNKLQILICNPLIIWKE